MDLAGDFEKFLSTIRPTESQRKDLVTGHRTLRSRLEADEGLKDRIVTTFLQGSYRRFTAVRPRNGKRADVDVVVVTTLDESEYDPEAALDLFKPFLNKHYSGKWHTQGRSLAIELSYVDLDLVVTSAPTEAVQEAMNAWRVEVSESVETLGAWLLAESKDLSAPIMASQAAWRQSPLRIPDRIAQAWEDTHPLEQIRWTQDKNAKCNGHYVNVVKAVKWWRRGLGNPKKPKGYPVEHMIGDSCPDGVKSVAEGLTLSLETMVQAFGPFADAGQVPWLRDRGVHQDVLGRTTVEEFKSFIENVGNAATQAREALDEPDRGRSGALWRELLGTEFPEPPTRGGTDRGGTDPDDKGGFTERAAPTVITDGRFA